MQGDGGTCSGNKNMNKNNREAARLKFRRPQSTEKSLSTILTRFEREYSLKAG